MKKYYISLFLLLMIGIAAIIFLGYRANQADEYFKSGSHEIYEDY